MSTGELDTIAEEFIRSHEGAMPAFKGLYGFPGSICASMNNEIVHGIPSKKRVLKDGDIISLDVGVGYKGYFTDSATTVAVGTISPEAQRLLDVTQRALDAGIAAAMLGNHIGDIGAAVQARGRGSRIQRGARPRRPRDRRRVPRGAAGAELRQAEAARASSSPGLTLAIEPMVNIGGPATKTLADRWTIVTLDGSLSAHFEHTVAITENGPRILTR